MLSLMLLLVVVQLLKITFIISHLVLLLVIVALKTVIQQHKNK